MGLKYIYKTFLALFYFGSSFCYDSYSSSSNMGLIKSMPLLIILSQIFGIFPFKVTQVGNFCTLEVSKPRLRYTITLFWILVLLGGSSAFSLALIYSINEVVSRLILTLSSITLYVDFILIFRIVVRKRDILCYWLNKINDLFESISPTNDTLHRMADFNRHLVLFSSSFMFIICVSEFTFEPVPLFTLFVGMVSLVRLYIIHLFLVQFSVLVNSVRVLYKVNHLNVSRKRQSRAPFLFWVKTLQNLKKIDLIMKDFVENLHSIYIPVLSVTFMWGFFSLLCTLVLGSKVGIPTVMLLEWILHILLEVSIPTILCHLASREATNMVSSLEESFIEADNEELLFEIETFSLQLQHRKLEFIVFESFKLDCSLLYSMAGATWTYSVIVLQFQNEHSTQIYLNSTNASNVII